MRRFIVLLLIFCLSSMIAMPDIVRTADRANLKFVCPVDNIQNEYTNFIQGITPTSTNKYQLIFTPGLYTGNITLTAEYVDLVEMIPGTVLYTGTLTNSTKWARATIGDTISTYRLMKTVRKTIGRPIVISAFADYGETVAGTVLATSNGHPLSTGDTITISGTTSYNATFTITKVSANTFYFTDTWVADEAPGLSTAYSTCDFSWVGNADTSEQVIDCGTIVPAYARVMDIALINTEGVTSGLTTFTVEAGTASSGAQYFAAATVFAANSVNALAAGGSPSVAISASTAHVYLAGNPGGNWSGMVAGKWTLLVTYIDYAMTK